MTPSLAEGLLLTLAAYLAIGSLFAVLFVSYGARQLDPAAIGAPLSARGLLLPGAAALWPYLAWRWLRRQHAPVA